MENYYEILEVPSEATFSEIKSSYKALCQQYHPDKLPLDTPEKAKKYLEERFKQLNEAYSTLSDPIKRKEYDYFLNVGNSQSSYSSQAQTHSNGNYPKTNTRIFDPEKMKEVAEKLETQTKTIEQEFEDRKKEIDESLKRKIKELGYKEDCLNGETILGKLGVLALAVLLSLLGFWVIQLGKNLFWLLNIFFFLIGAGWIGFWGLVAIFCILSPTIDANVAEKIKPLKEKASEKKQEAEEKINQELNNLELYQRNKVNFFKTIPIETISDDYILGLSDEDQFFLLQAIQERQDAEQLKQNVQTAVGVVAKIGIIALMIGLGGTRF